MDLQKSSYFMEIKIIKYKGSKEVGLEEKVDDINKSETREIYRPFLKIYHPYKTILEGKIQRMPLRCRQRKKWRDYIKRDEITDCVTHKETENVGDPLHSIHYGEGT